MTPRILVLLLLFAASCAQKEQPENITVTQTSTDSSLAKKPVVEIDDNNHSGDTTAKEKLTEPNSTKMGGRGADTAQAQHIIAFAKSFLGTPYKYASADPAEGFDCSGFLYHVFHKFNIDVPRSSVDYTDFGKQIHPAQAKPGDFILFTGTDSTIRTAGHVGVITHYDNSTIYFIHSSSGKANGVTITPLNDYYRGRYLKTIRILKTNGL